MYGASSGTLSTVTSAEVTPQGCQHAGHNVVLKYSGVHERRDENTNDDGGLTGRCWRPNHSHCA